MSRKHYEAIAAAVRAETLLAEDRTALSGMGLRLADIFAADNPNFDRTRFLRACEI